MVKLLERNTPRETWESRSLFVVQRHNCISTFTETLTKDAPNVHYENQIKIRREKKARREKRKIKYWMRKSELMERERKDKIPIQIFTLPMIFLLITWKRWSFFQKIIFFLHRRLAFEMHEHGVDSVSTGIDWTCESSMTHCLINGKPPAWCINWVKVVSYSRIHRSRIRERSPGSKAFNEQWKTFIIIIFLLPIES